MSRTFVSGSSSTAARGRGSMGRPTRPAGAGQAETLRDQSQFSMAPRDQWDSEREMRETGYEPSAHHSACGRATEEDQASVGGERRLECHSGFYVQRPKPSHNQKLKTMAQDETAAYHEHKAEKRAQLAEQTRQLQPQVLGGASTSAGALQERRVTQEREQNMKAKFASVHRQQKREEYVQAKRMREEAELEEKKRIQREKALQLQQKQGGEEKRQREEMRRARLARFT